MKQRKGECERERHAGREERREDKRKCLIVRCDLPASVAIALNSRGKGFVHRSMQMHSHGRGGVR